MPGKKIWGKFRHLWGIRLAKGVIATGLVVEKAVAFSRWENQAICAGQLRRATDEGQEKRGQADSS
jgi:hypothetical protein